MATIYIIEPSKPDEAPHARGAWLVRDALRAAGHEAVLYDLAPRGAPTQHPLFPVEGSVDPASLPVPDAWYISTIYARQWLHLPRLLERIGVAVYAADRRDSDPLIALGGQAVLTPEPIAPFADVLALGDGELTGVALAGHLDIGGGRPAAMEWARGRPGYYVPVLQQPPEPFVRITMDGISASKVMKGGTGAESVVEAARGCKYKCAFCVIGWAERYREANKEDVLAHIRQSRATSLNIYAADFASVSYAADIQREMQALGIAEAGRDARMGAAGQYLQIEGGRRSFYFGIEGVSARIRQAFGKALSDQAIVDMMRRLSGAGGVIKWYLIPGAPGETDEDRGAFLRMLERVREVYSARNLTITPTFFQAIPHTPLQWADNRFPARAEAWMQDLRALLTRWSQEEGRVRWLAYQHKAREWHEFETYIRRLGRDGAHLLVAIEGKEMRVASGRWRQTANILRLPQIETTLCQLDPRKPTPWSHVDVGMRARPVLAAWEHYWRVMQAAPGAA